MAQRRQRRREILIKGDFSIYNFHHHLSTMRTSETPHTTVKPLKAQQLFLVPFKQLIYLTGMPTGGSPSLLLNASLHFCNSERLLDTSESIYYALRWSFFLKSAVNSKSNQPYVLHCCWALRKSFNNILSQWGKKNLETGNTKLLQVQPSELKQ